MKGANSPLQAGLQISGERVEGRLKPNYAGSEGLAACLTPRARFTKRPLLVPRRLGHVEVCADGAGRVGRKFQRLAQPHELLRKAMTAEGPDLRLELLSLSLQSSARRHLAHLT